MAQQQISADTVGILLVLEAMAFSAVIGALSVDGWLAVVGYVLAIYCFELLILIFALETTVAKKQRNIGDE